MTMKFKKAYDSIMSEKRLEKGKDFFEKKLTDGSTRWIYFITTN